MDKTAQLKSVAKGLAAGGILGAGAGVVAHEHIRNNKNNARTVKGWETRRRNTMTKESSESDTVSEVKSAVRALGTNLDHPTKAASSYVRRSLVRKIRHMISGMRKPKYGE